MFMTIWQYDWLVDARQIANAKLDSPNRSNIAISQWQPSWHTASHSASPLLSLRQRVLHHATIARPNDEALEAQIQPLSLRIIQNHSWKSLLPRFVATNSRQRMAWAPSLTQNIYISYKYILYYTIYVLGITMSRNVTKHLNRSGSLLSKCRQLRSVVGAQLAERQNVKYQQDSKYRQKDTSSALSYILEESHKAPWHSTVSILFRAAARIRLRYYSIP